MQSFAKFRDDNNGRLAMGGTTAAATVATNQVFTALNNGLTISFFVPHGLGLNAGATLAVDGLTAAPIELYAGTAITTGQIVGGTIVGVTYETKSTSWVVNSSIQTGPLRFITLFTSCAENDLML